jgi:hypothetical protein
VGLPVSLVLAGAILAGDGAVMPVMPGGGRALAE